jgi:hypothetical protein
LYRHLLTTRRPRSAPGAGRRPGEPQARLPSPGSRRRGGRRCARAPRVLTEASRDVVNFLASVKQQRRVTVPERVKPHCRQAGACHELAERVRDVPGLYGLPSVQGRRARWWSCQPVPIARRCSRWAEMVANHLARVGPDPSAALGPCRLRFTDDEFTVDHHGVVDYVDGAGVEVDIAPAETERLTTAKSGRGHDPRHSVDRRARRRTRRTAVSAQATTSAPARWARRRERTDSSRAPRVSWQGGTPRSAWRA